MRLNIIQKNYTDGNIVYFEDYSIEKVIEYNGFSPIYMMENYEDLAKELHWNIYEDEDYQPSSTIVQLEQNIQNQFGGSWKGSLYDE